MGALQAWLQGGYPWHASRRPWISVWLGNRISDARYLVWRALGGTHEA